MKTKSNKENSFWKVPQLSVAIFVIFSAYTTGQGMSETFFDGSYICGVSISIGIQLLLVWLGQKVPKLFAMGDRKVQITLILLYGITVFWSAGFSFVYVCNHIYSSVYMLDDQSLLADTYRKDIFELKQYADDNFNLYLDKVIDGIQGLQEKAAGLEEGAGNSSGAIPDFDYLDAYFSADSYMLDIIAKCRNLSQGKTLGDTDSILDEVNSILNDIQNELKEFEGKINEKQSRLDLLDEEIRAHSIEKYKYKPGSTADQELDTLIEEKKNEKSIIKTEKESLETEWQRKEQAEKALQSLSSFIRLKAQSAVEVISSQFAEMIAELGSVNPDFDKIDNTSDKIYTRLVEAAREGGDVQAYCELLDDYLLLKASMQELKDVRSIQDFCSKEDEAIIIRDTEILVSSLPSTAEKEKWQTLWNDKFVELKAAYYTISAASESDVIRSCDYISWLQRSLLTDLNGIERAKYYLFCAHPMLACLSMGLALFLDLVPILLMIVKQRVKRPGSQSETPQLQEGEVGLSNNYLATNAP